MAEQTTTPSKQVQWSPENLFSGKFMAYQVPSDRAFRIHGNHAVPSQVERQDAGGDLPVGTERDVLRGAFNILQSTSLNGELFKKPKNGKDLSIDYNGSSSSSQVAIEPPLEPGLRNEGAQIEATGRHSFGFIKAFDVLSKTSPDLGLRVPHESEIRVLDKAFDSFNNDSQLVVAWLIEVGLAKYKHQFQANSITLDMLGSLSLQDLKRLIPLAEDRLRFRKLVATANFRSSPLRDYKTQSTASVEITSNSLAANSRSITPDYHSVVSTSDKDAITHSSLLSTPDLGSSLLKAHHQGFKKGIQITSNEINHKLKHITASTEVRNRQSHRSLSRHNRPTSREVTKRISEFFPDTDQRQLYEGLRNSRMLTERFSISRGSWRQSFRNSKRISTTSNYSVTRSSLHNEAAILQYVSLESPLLDGNNGNLLEFLDNEEMSPTNWTRGQLIGTGSYGSVYLAFNSFTGDILAVKQVRIGEDTNGSNSLVEGLRREIEFLRDLDHENIVQYRGFKREGGLINIFLEYVSGGSLASYVKQRGGLPENEVVEYMRQCLHGLNYLHDRGIIHRDIKGANILLNNNLKVKISDFGLSKQEQPNAHRFSMQGTAYWMAPEVARASRSTTKADIWSLGCLLIEIYSGEHPFSNLTAFQAIFKIGNGTKPEIPSNCSENMKHFLELCFEVDPDKRASAHELLLHPFVVRTESCSRNEFTNKI